MQLQQIKLLLVASLSAGSFLFAGCTQQRQFDAQAQSDAQTQAPAAPTAPSVQVEAPATDVQTQQQPADVPFVPTPEVVVAEMLKQGQVKGNDVLYDLGSGDGRIVITAAKQFGTRGTGVDINPQLVQESRENAQKAGVSDRVRFLQQDLFTTDLSDATVVTLYLLPDVNLRLRPKLLKELKPGTRIVSHNYDMGEWKPEQVVQVESSPGRQHTIYTWVVPATIPENLK
ncbi:class I SAM-dependent methyltransferase [Coleofasciculus sp. FACHB-T130]|uniref:SAM-dependent methyltransferase n=1 Tax=Cyanophyceae TaxID=3028117 RepID=UPI00168571AA|nr:class I SAM-dependent methyltransferase [Coleofasciculus sp. FACHB-T130]MBD1878409.1 class I SAM-dependent methyltransferase [Coleofasciculus sp. FACHB-T130]